MSAKKSKKFYLKIALAIFYGVNLLFALFKEIFLKITGKKQQKEEAPIIGGESKEYDQLFYVIILVPIILGIVLYIFPDSFLLILILYLSIFQILSSIIIILKPSHILFLNANPLKILEEYSSIRYYLIVDGILYLLTIMLQAFEVITLPSDFQFAIYTTLIFGFLNSIGVFIIINKHLEPRKNELEQYVLLEKYMGFFGTTVAETEKNIKKIEKIAGIAKNSHLDYIISICLVNIKSQYTHLIKLLTKIHNKDKIKQAKQKYQRFYQKFN